jgi:hypothetical protein
MGVCGLCRRLGRLGVAVPIGRNACGCNHASYCRWVRQTALTNLGVVIVLWLLGSCIDWLCVLCDDNNAHWGGAATVKLEPIEYGLGPTPSSGMVVSPSSSSFLSSHDECVWKDRDDNLCGCYKNLIRQQSIKFLVKKLSGDLVSNT